MGEKFEVDNEGAVNVTGLRISTGVTPLTGKQLTSDAEGNATWQPSNLPDPIPKHDIGGTGAIMPYEPKLNLHVVYANVQIADDPANNATKVIVDSLDGVDGHTINGLEYHAKLNFKGNACFVEDNPTNESNDVFVPGGTGGGHIIQKDGRPFFAEPKLRFVGDGVTVDYSGEPGSTCHRVTIPQLGSNYNGHTIIGGVDVLPQQPNLNFDGGGVQVVDWPYEHLIHIEGPITSHHLLSGLLADGGTNDHPQYLFWPLLDTPGSIFYRGTTGTQKLSRGTQGQILTADDTAGLVWKDPMMAPKDHGILFNLDHDDHTQYLLKAKYPVQAAGQGLFNFLYRDAYGKTFYYCWGDLTFTEVYLPPHGSETGPTADDIGSEITIVKLGSGQLKIYANPAGRTIASIGEAGHKTLKNDGGYQDPSNPDPWTSVTLRLMPGYIWMPTSGCGTWYSEA